ncbi:MAG: hypothetical protein MUF42_06060 [Cytophagaceae bacterium]|jgi:hypothetical protein|nr:hypothetical protein [Cytophagaceae bacterium]
MAIQLSKSVNIQAQEENSWREAFSDSSYFNILTDYESIKTPYLSCLQPYACLEKPFENMYGSWDHLYS